MALPFVFAYGLGPQVVDTTNLVLPANGGTIALWVPLSDRITVLSASARTLDTTGSHTLEVNLYGDDALLPARGTVSSFTFTATAAANRTGNLVAPVLLSAGMAWLVVRNAGAASTSLAAVANGTFGANNCALTATLAQSLATADMRTVAWTPAATIPLIRLDGGFTPISSGQFGW